MRKAAQRFDTGHASVIGLKVLVRVPRHTLQRRLAIALGNLGHVRVIAAFVSDGQVRRMPQLAKTTRQIAGDFFRAAADIPRADL